jgi:hypothetical protein
MTKRNKQALYTLAISIPSFGLGLWSFEIGGGGGAIGLISAIGITLGAAGVIAGVTMLSTKNRLGWFDSEPFDYKPIFKKKEKIEVNKIKKEEPVEKSGSESIGLMQREKELVKRSDELNALVTELDAELNQVREDLQTKGWIQSADGWIIG